jgi:copper(I)-binding protein
MKRFITALVLMTALSGTFLISTHSPASAARYKVACIAPNGPWCRIFCQSNRGVACYANVVNGRCLKTCRYQ